MRLVLTKGPDWEAIGFRVTQRPGAEEGEDTDFVIEHGSHVALEALQERRDRAIRIRGYVVFEMIFFVLPVGFLQKKISNFDDIFDNYFVYFFYSGGAQGSVSDLPPLDRTGPVLAGNMARQNRDVELRFAALWVLMVLLAIIPLCLAIGAVAAGGSRVWWRIREKKIVDVVVLMMMMSWV
jgi:hypothetical protein